MINFLEAWMHDCLTHAMIDAAQSPVYGTACTMVWGFEVWDEIPEVKT